MVTGGNPGLFVQFAAAEQNNTHTHTQTHSFGEKQHFPAEQSRIGLLLHILDIKNLRLENFRPIDTCQEAPSEIQLSHTENERIQVFSPTPVRHRF